MYACVHEGAHASCRARDRRRLVLQDVWLHVLLRLANEDCVLIRVLRREAELCMHACVEGRTRPMKSKMIVLSRAGKSPFEAQGARGCVRWIDNVWVTGTGVVCG
jgi:hypothetical protein